MAQIFPINQILTAAAPGTPWLPEDAATPLAFKGEFDDASKFNIVGGQVIDIYNQVTGDDLFRYTYESANPSATYDDVNKRLVLDGIAFQHPLNAITFYSFVAVVEDVEGHYEHDTSLLLDDCPLAGSNARNRILYADTAGALTYDSNANNLDASINGEPLVAVPAAITGYIPYPSNSLDCWYLQHTNSNTIRIFNGGRGADLRELGKAKYADCLIYDGALSADDLDRAFGYLMHRNGIQAKLPAGHPYRNNPPMK